MFIVYKIFCIEDLYQSWKKHLFLAIKLLLPVLDYYTKEYHDSV